MDYQQAATIARNRPGTTLTRDESGAFVVRGAQGELITGPNSNIPNTPAISEELLQERDDLRESQGNIRELEDQIQELALDRNRLRCELSSARIIARNLQETIETLQKENRKLRARIGKVSESELQRIRAEEIAEREVEIAEMKTRRYVVECACCGEVENCARCYGSGTYTVDGYGNIV